jgi:hypothetical protein
MDNEAAKLGAEIEHYRELLRFVVDSAVVEALERMIAERQDRLLAIEGGRESGRATFG